MLRTKVAGLVTETENATHTLFTWITPSGTQARIKVVLGAGTQREVWDMAANVLKFEMVDNLHMERTNGDAPPADDIFAMWIQFAIAHCKQMSGVED
jgi:hypothetical protein